MDKIITAKEARALCYDVEKKTLEISEMIKTDATNGFRAIYLQKPINKEVLTNFKIVGFSVNDSEENSNEIIISW